MVTGGSNQRGHLPSEMCPVQELDKRDWNLMIWRRYQF